MEGDFSFGLNAVLYDHRGRENICRRNRKFGFAAVCAADSGRLQPNALRENIPERFVLSAHAFSIGISSVRKPPIGGFFVTQYVYGVMWR